MSIIVETEGDSVSIEDALPIREISRLTGVNTVTLRAWERRYGLLIPQRTSKGHRLYSRSDIDRVREIQVWLGRGLAIGKVKALLADEQRGDFVPEIDSIWLQLSQQIQMTITAFNRNQLERLIEETFSLYPVPMIADYLLLPLIAELQGEEPGRPVRRGFFAAVLLEYIQAAQCRQRQAAQGAKILMVSATPDEDSLLPQILNYGLLVNQYQAEFLGYLNAKESLLAAEALTAKIVVIIGSETVNTSELQLHLNLLRERSATAVVLAGNVARVVRALAPEFSSVAYACDSQQQVLTTINQLLKG
ncbi:MerR family transcriptional regulator [Cellvibrio sp.]